MYFYKKKYKNRTVLTLNTDFIDDKTTDEILLHLGKNKKIGLDMTNVKKIRSRKFIDCLLTDKFGLFNLKNEILVYLSLILKDGFLKSYMTVDDFSKNKRELTRRRFLVA